MAISTFKVFLMQGGDKVVDIKDFPDLGGAPEMIDTTTLSNKSRTYIPGIQEQEALEFTVNYTKEDFTKLKKLEGEEKEYGIWFGGNEEDGNITPTGTDGKFEFKGYLTVFVTGGGVNEVVNMTVSIAPSSVITVSNLD